MLWKTFRKLHDTYGIEKKDVTQGFLCVLPNHNLNTANVTVKSGPSWQLHARLKGEDCRSWHWPLNSSLRNGKSCPSSPPPPPQYQCTWLPMCYILREWCLFSTFFSFSFCSSSFPFSASPVLLPFVSFSFSLLSLSFFISLSVH